MQEDIIEQRELLRADLHLAQNKLETIHGRARAITNRLTKAGRDPTASEDRELEALRDAFDAGEADVLRIKAEIDDIERTPMGRRAGPNPIASSAGPTARSNPQSQAARLAAGDRSYGALFGNVARDPSPRDEFASLGEFARAVVQGNDPRLIRNVSPSTTTEGASAGYLVPTYFVQQMMDDALAMEVVRPRANVIPISSQSAIVAGFNYVDGTGTSRAGLRLLWGVESAPGGLDEQKPLARELSMAARKGHIFCRVSNELAADAPNFDRMLMQAMTAAVASGLDYAFVNGTGAGQPLGVVKAPCVISVAKESGQAANTLMFQNLAKMVGRLAPSSFARSVWLVHPTLVPLLYTLSFTQKNVAGTENVGGSSVQAVTVGPDGGLRIFGLPALVSDACSTLSSQGDIILADFSRYLIGMRAEVRMERDTSVFFNSDETAFRLTLRLDGMPEDSAPTKLRDGTNTVSPFVTLDAR